MTGKMRWGDLRYRGKETEKAVFPKKPHRARWAYMASEQRRSERPLLSLMLSQAREPATVMSSRLSYDGKLIIEELSNGGIRTRPSDPNWKPYEGPKAPWED